MTKMNFVLLNNIIIYAALLSSCLCMLFFVFQQPSRELIFMQNTVCAGIFVLAGYLIYYNASSLNMLIVGTKLQYLGGCSMLPLLLAFTTKVYQYHVPRKVWIIPVILDAVLTMVTISFDKNDWFYTMYYVAPARTGAMLAVKYAWGHSLFVATLIAYLCLYTLLFIRRILSDEKGERWETISFFILIMVPIGSYIYSQQTDGKSFALLPLAIFVTEVIGTGHVMEQRFSDLYEQSVYVILDSMSAPLLVVDKHYRLQGLNQAAKSIYPEFSGFSNKLMRVKVPEEIRQIILVCEKGNGSGRNGYVQIREYSYLPECHPVMLKDRRIGTVVCLNDMTHERAEFRRLEDSNRKLQRDARLEADKIIQVQNDMLIGFETMLSFKSVETGSHLERTSGYVFTIAYELLQEKQFPDELNNKYIEILQQVAPLHDIGKNAIPESILEKPGALTAEEREIMNTHVLKGAEFIQKTLKKDFNDLYYKLAYEVALYHHEAWDGSGYVYGLKGEAIPLAARIMAVADVFDALAYPRPYKRAYTLEESYAIIVKERNTKFDPIITDAFIASWPMIKAQFYEFRDKDKENLEELDEIEELDGV